MRSLLGKLILVQIICALIVVLLLHKQMQKGIEAGMNDDFVTHGQTIANALAKAVENPLINHDLTSVQSALDANLATPCVEWGYVTGPDGTVLAHTFVPEFPSYLQTEGARLKSGTMLTLPGTSKPVSVFKTPVLTGIVGTITIGINRDRLNTAIYQTEKTAVLGVAIVMLVVTTISTLATRRLLKPVHTLTNAANALEHQGIATFQELPIHSRDEIGTLTKSFNAMVHVIQEHNETLEQRIRERTQELEEAITRAERIASELRESQRFVERITQTSPDIIYVYDLIEQRSIYVNREIAPALGYSPEQIKQMGDALLTSLVHPDDMEVIRENHRAFLTAPETEVREYSYRMRHANGDWHWLNTRTAIFDRTADGQPRQIVGVAQDITGRKEQEEQIQRQMTQIQQDSEELARQKRQLEAANAALQALATTDGLTELANHRAFQDTLRAETIRAQRQGTRLSLLLLDVDHFKHYNDSYGHPAGDEVLRVVARLLRESVRAHDFPARYGGEEFAIILPDTTPEGARTVAEHIRSKIADYTFPYREVTVSIGLASQYPMSADSHTLVDEADQALFGAKRAGRNRVMTAEESANASANTAKENDDAAEKIPPETSTLTAALSASDYHCIEGWLDVPTGQLLGDVLTLLDLHEGRSTGHSLRVARFALRLMQELVALESIKATPGDLRDLTFGSLLHNLSALDIRTASFETATHTARETTLIERFPLLAPGLPILHYHRENWDGTGVHGLAGADIPLAARIFAIANELEALCHTEAEALPCWEACQQIANQAGVRFDPEIVRAFLNVPQTEWETLGRVANDPPPLSLLPETEERRKAA